MSSASVTSSKREIASTELAQELEAVRRLVKNLQVYLETLRVFRKGLKDINDNCEQLKKVNLQWIDLVNTMREI